MFNKESILSGLITATGILFAFKLWMSLQIVVILGPQFDTSILMGALLSTIAGVLVGIGNAVEDYTDKPNAGWAARGLGFGTFVYVWHGLYELGSSNQLTAFMLIAVIAWAITEKFIGVKLIGFRRWYLSHFAEKFAEL